MFLKLKDPKYFEEVVRPFLTNKMEKTFVDYWLLEYDAALNTFEEPHSKNFIWSKFILELKDLNSFEQCLLISYLVIKGKKERAQQIADSLREKSIPPSVDYMNRIYDTVLNMNSLNSKPSDGIL